MLIGVRVEVTNRLTKIKTLDKIYKKKFHQEHIFDFNVNGRITVEKIGDMIIARGRKEDKFTTGMSNFAAMEVVMLNQEEISRIAKIVNVLGNDRLIKEKIRTFIDGKSVLNNLTEFDGLTLIFNNINNIAPGFLDNGWYYAPEIKI